MLSFSSLPKCILNSEELDEVQTRPSQELVDLMRQLDGDILILGAAGKMGPTLARMAVRAVDLAGIKKQVIAVSRSPMPALEKRGVKTVQCDLMNLDEVRRLPQVPNVIFMVGRKFGSTGSEHQTWMTNVIVPHHVAQCFPKSKMVVFSTGCVYPLVHIKTGGATERTPPAPVGEYAMSCLGRERVFDDFAEKGGKAVHVRLFYAVELRYGVLVDIAQTIWSGKPTDVTTGFANVIWQGDACDQIIRSLNLATSPATILNITGPETLSIREVALTLGKLMEREVKFTGEENGFGYLGNASLSHRLLGNPKVPVGLILEWVAHWVKSGGEWSGKPTHFEVQDGKF